MMHDIYPPSANVSTQDESNMAVRLFGNKIFADQSLYEYIIEFLLVFAAPKNEDKTSNKMEFHSDLVNELAYYVKPRIGLKRFIFYERSKRAKKIAVDEKAYEDIVSLLCEKIGDRYTHVEKISDAVNSLQDLFYGYSAVLKNRSWLTQSLLPIAPELLFCEVALISQGKRYNKTNRYHMHTISNAYDEYGYSELSTLIETGFTFQQRNYMARGGEVYYLHILQALGLLEDEAKSKLVRLLNHLLTSSSKDLSAIANWIDDIWIKEQNINPNKLWQKKVVGHIPQTGYIDCGKNAVNELTNFLMNEMHPITRIELLAKGIVLQIMRMMCFRTNEYLGINTSPWIIDLRSKKSGKTVMKVSSDSFRRVEELFTNAINKQTSDYLHHNCDREPSSAFDYLRKARSYTLNMFKRLGKEMQCIIPIKGGHERFSLSEDLVKFLVLSIIKPQGKITFDMFLDKLYEHFNIVIGPKQYKQCAVNSQFDVEQADAFRYNEIEFQNYLKNTGFLRDLSDATSIVINPYLEVEI